MANEDLKAKYARIANDPSQLEMFKNDLIDGNVLPEAIAFDADVEVMYMGVPAIKGSDVDFGDGIKLIKVHNYLNGIATVSRASGATDYTIWLMDFQTGDAYNGSGAANSDIILKRSSLSFDGVVQVTTIYDNPGIEASNWPTKSGLYRLSGNAYGIMIYNNYGSSSPIRGSIITYLSSGQDIGLKVYDISVTPQSSFSFIAGNEHSFATKLYKHVITLLTSVAYQQIIIVSNISTSFKTLGNIEVDNTIVSGSLKKYASGTNAVNGVITEVTSHAPYSSYIVYYFDGTTISNLTVQKTDIDTDTVTSL